MLVAAAAVGLRGVARDDEAISDSHRLHICDNDAARCRPHRRGWHLHLRIEWQSCGQRGSIARNAL